MTSKHVESFSIVVGAALLLSSMLWVVFFAMGVV